MPLENRMHFSSVLLHSSLHSYVQRETVSQILLFFVVSEEVEYPFLHWCL